MSGKVAIISDDDEYFRMAMSGILTERLKFANVIETDSFDTAIESLESSGPVQLAVFDLFMPGLEGPAGLRAVRENFEVEKMVVVSSSASRSDILGSLEAGAHGYVHKGQGVSGLQSALRQILNGEVYVPLSLTDLSKSQDDPRSRPAQATASPSSVPNLTPRQLDVMEMLVEGKSNKEIARALDLGHSTVKVHLAALFTKLGVTSRSAAAVAGTRILPLTSRGANASSGNRKQADR